MVGEGVRLAAARRPAMERLIETNPRLALEVAVRAVVRQDLPEEVRELLEKPVSGRGDYKAYFGRPVEGAVVPAGTELTLRYFETPEGDSYRAHVFGQMEEAVSRRGVAMRGVAIGRELAVAESPVRQMEAGERIEAGTPVDETCPVSGTVTPTKTEETLVVEPEVPLVEVGGAGDPVVQRDARDGV
jgi:hypothetical protein